MKVELDLNRLSAAQIVHIVGSLDRKHQHVVAEYVYLKIRMTPEYWQFTAENQRQFNESIERARKLHLPGMPRELVNLTGAESEASHKS